MEYNSSREYSNLKIKKGQTSLYKRNKIVFFFFLATIFLLQMLNVASFDNNDFGSMKNRSKFENKNFNLTKSKMLNIAIIGSGISGLSTAYFLKKNKHLNIAKIDIFEREARLGGRIYSQKIFNRSENLGASFMIKKNQLVFSLIKELNLKIYSTLTNSDTSFGLYKNKTIFFSLGNSKLINIIKMFWRYGFSIIREKMLMKSNMEKFSKIYEALNSKTIFYDVRQLLSFIGLEDLAIQPIGQYLKSRNINEKYIDEFVNLLLRIIYNQQNEVNAFAGFITLIGGSYESYRIEGGNFLLIEKLAEILIDDKAARDGDSANKAAKDFQTYGSSDFNSKNNHNNNILFGNKAKVSIKKNHEVIKVQKITNNDNKGSQKYEFYDLFYKDIDINNNNKKCNNTHAASEDDYNNIDKDKSSDFNNKKNSHKNYKKEKCSEVKRESYDIVVLASPLQYSRVELHLDIDKRKLNLMPFENFFYFIKGKLRQKLFEEFTSEDIPGMLISYNINQSHNILYIKKLNIDDKKDQFKVNSNKILNDEILKIYFEDDYSIVYFNHWDFAYPQLEPRELENLPSFELSENIYYVNAIESVASSIELAMISAKNIVNLIENKYFPFLEIQAVKKTMKTWDL